jgi:hypothetical protein
MKYTNYFDVDKNYGYIYADMKFIRRWRALCLVIKAKLEAVQSGISEFEDEFLANIVLPTGETVLSSIRPRIAEMYKTGNTIPLLPDMRG